MAYKEIKEYKLKSINSEAKTYHSNIRKKEREILKLQRQIEKLKKKIEKAQLKNKEINVKGITEEIMQCKECISRLKGEIKAERSNIELLEFAEARYNNEVEFGLGNITEEEFMRKEALIGVLTQKAQDLYEGKLGERAGKLHDKKERDKNILDKMGKPKATVEFKEVGEKETPQVETGRTATESKPERETTPRPERGTAPRPERGTAPRPERETAPRPERETVPRPERETVPRPERETAPKPERETAPRPEHEAEPKPEQNTNSIIETLKNIDFSKLGIDGINNYEDLLNIDSIDKIYELLERLENQELEIEAPEIEEPEVEAPSNITQEEFDAIVEEQELTDEEVAFAYKALDRANKTIVPTKDKDNERD